jgi:hypothetical protein
MRSRDMGSARTNQFNFGSIENQIEIFIGARRAVPLLLDSIPRASVRSHDDTNPKNP